MKKSTIWIIAIIMVVSFTALLWLQFSYISEMAKMKKEQFDESVTRALYTAAHNLELNETLTYEVDHIWIVEPKDLTHLQIRPGQDLCTLITCTPYGINTHRLLVQGHRIENADGDALIIADALRIRPVYIAPFLAIPIIAVLLIYLLISTSSKSRSTIDYKAMYMREHGLKEAKLPRTDRGIADSDPEDSGVEDSDQIPDTIREFIDKLQ